MKKVHVTIDGIDVYVPEDYTILEAAKEPNTFPETILSIGSDYIEGFNKLDHRSQFIETEEREDIFNAFEQILNETGLSEFKEEIIQLIDEKRSW